MDRYHDFRYRVALADHGGVYIRRLLCFRTTFPCLPNLLATIGIAKAPNLYVWKFQQAIFGKRKIGLWYMFACPDSFGCLALCLIFRVSLVQRHVMLLVTQGLLHALQPLNRRDKLHPSSPDRPILRLRPFSSVVLEMIKDPESDDPGRNDEVGQSDLLTKPERTFRMQLLRKLFDVFEEFFAAFLGFFALELEPAVVGGDDVAANESDPDTCPGLFVRVRGHQLSAVFGWVIVDLVKVFGYDAGLDKRLAAG